MTNCKFCKGSGKILLLENEVDCLECNNLENKIIEKKENIITEKNINKRTSGLKPKVLYRSQELQDLAINNFGNLPYDYGDISINDKVEKNKSEKKAKDIIYGSTFVNPKEQKDYELLTKKGLFQPKKIRIICREGSDLGVYIPIMINSITIRNIPQITGNTNEFIISDFFENYVKVKWISIGPIIGEGLKFSLHNSSPYHCCIMSIMILGEWI